MPKLRRLDGKEVIAILEQFGFTVIRSGVAITDCSVWLRAKTNT